jgi:hypothetical protein
MAFAGSALAVDSGQAGESDVYQCELIPAGDGWGNVTLKALDESYSFVVTAHGLTPGAEYELWSGGVFKAEATANGGGNVLFKGTVLKISKRLNVILSGIPAWVLHTDLGCLPTP